MATPVVPYNYVGPLAPGQTRAPAPNTSFTNMVNTYNASLAKPNVPAPPAPSNPYNPANLVKPFASLATPFSAIFGKPAMPNLPTPLAPNPIGPTIQPKTGVVSGASTTARPPLPFGAAGPLAPGQTQEAAPAITTPPTPPPPQPSSTLTFPDSIATPSGLTADPATGSVTGPAETVQGGATPPPLASPGAGIPGTGNGTGYGSPAYLKAKKDYEDSLKMSSEEESNQKERDNLESSLKIGEANTGNQPIAMEFITGQKKAMEDRTLALDVPLQKKAALLQAKRLATVDANKFSLDQMDKKIAADAEAHKPVSVAPGSTLVDPATGKSVYSAPAKPDTSVVEANGHKYLIDNTSGNTIKDLGTSNGPTTADDQLVGSQIHTVNGTDAKGQPFAQPFINLTDFPDSASKKSALAYGAANGIPVLNPGEGEKMVSIDNAYTNLDKMGTGLDGLLANTKGLNMAEGLWKGITNKFGDDGVRSFNAWRTAVINNVQALAGGSGSGLRINQAEIDTALKNDLPVVTGLGADTVSSAQAKLNRLKDQLDSWRSTILDKGNAAGKTESDPLGLGFNQGSGGTPTATKTGMRTDRNNNPTAMTTDVAKSLGLVEGRDYVNAGDTFSGGKYSTAKLLGDPVQTTIKAFDQAASRSAAEKAKNGGAFATASGGKRWSYGTPSDAQWLSMSPAQKIAAVQQMYQHEGGSQLAGAFKTKLA